MSNGTPAPERPTLSREFSEFLVDFSVALHKHAMYPTSHPSLEERAGLEFDPDLVAAFIQMLREGEAQVRVLSEETSI